MGNDRRITREQTRREREYGPYWYSALWQLVRPVLVWACARLLPCDV